MRPADSQNRSVPFRDDNDSPRLPSGTQAIITSYQFHCCGNITAWQTYVQPGGGGHNNGVYTINFQVWRPSPTVNADGCYSLVGENRFPSISFPENGVVSETPAPSNIITVRPGDVVGYFTMTRDGRNEGIQLDTDFNDETVWYNGGNLIRNEGQSCPFPVGPTRTLSASTNAAPVLSIDISKWLLRWTLTIWSPELVSHLYSHLTKSQTSINYIVLSSITGSPLYNSHLVLSQG